jgi:predicted metalloendopeptidase
MENHRELGAEILGHVIAHEIGHVLEGIARHSPEGLMKAHWGLHDYMRMKKQRLCFSTEDVDLMRRHFLSADGLAAPSGRE